MTDYSKIVSAAIYPAIGIARVGNSRDEFFIGPEIPWPDNKPAGFYKDKAGAIKRQAARFRVYGINAAGNVVKELTAEDAEITWTVHVANKKAAWYEFNQALDIESSPPAARRNANFQGKDREQLIIDPGQISISGKNKSGSQYFFNKGTFMGESVYLGELCTDDAGRLLFLGGHGISKSPFPNNPPSTFADNSGWHDDTSDGSVTAKVVYDSQELNVEPAWVVTAPPNYAPDLIGIQTMWDVMNDAFQNGFYIDSNLTPDRDDTKTLAHPSFMQDIYPLLQQFSMAQWVNFGFYVTFGYNQPFDFENKDYIAKLANPDIAYREYRRQIFNSFRPLPPDSPKDDSLPDMRLIDPEAWPWMYGDEMDLPSPQKPRAFLSVTSTLYGYLQQWLDGNFINDWNPNFTPPKSIDDIKDPQEQAEAINKAALWFCLGGPFHPGCEMTWPMRYKTMYTKPFRIRHRSTNNPEPDYGDQLTYDIVMSSNGPLHFQGPGDITRWMAVPWQTDTASCRAGYDSKYDPWVPTFWPARVPNHVLAEKEYNDVMDTTKSREERLAAFNTRATWYRILASKDNSGYLNEINNMIDRYGALGVVEYRPGLPDDPDFPDVMYVESKPGIPSQDVAEKAGQVLMVVDGIPVDDIPYDRGLYVGLVEKVRPKE